MVFTKTELKEVPKNVKINNMLTIEDLITNFAVTSGNKILFPIARVEYEDMDFQTGQYEASEKNIYALEDLLNMKIYLDTVHRGRLNPHNRRKYILGNEKVISCFECYGWETLEISEESLNNQKAQQQYLLDNNHKQILISHTDCGYEYRSSDGELKYRGNIAEYICDGTNDTEILQQAINSTPDENVDIMLSEDEYIVKPTSGSGTAEDPYICLNINRDNVILRSCGRRTNITVDRDIVKENDVCYIIAVNGENVDISNIHFGLDELDIHYVEYAYPKPTEKMLEVKTYVEDISTTEKTFSKAEVLKLINGTEDN